jgi:hypothetical protein
VDSGSEPASTPKRRRRGTMTATQRKAVGERMKKYWAARCGGSETTGATSSDSTERASKPAAGAAKRGPRNISPEARKRISDAQKAMGEAARRGKPTEASSTGGTSAAAQTTSDDQAERQRRRKTRPPQDVRRRTEAHVGGAEETAGSSETVHEIG